MEFKKGCPACEHSDPQLEREMEQLAQLLFDAYLEEKGLISFAWYPERKKPKDASDER